MQTLKNDMEVGWLWADSRDSLVSFYTEDMEYLIEDNYQSKSTNGIPMTVTI